VLVGVGRARDRYALRLYVTIILQTENERWVPTIYTTTQERSRDFPNCFLLFRVLVGARRARDRDGAEGDHPPAQVVQDELVLRRRATLRRIQVAGATH